MVGGVGAFESNRHAITSDTDDTYGARNPGQAWGGVLMGASRPGLAPQLTRPSNWNESWLGHWQS